MVSYLFAKQNIVGSNPTTPSKTIKINETMNAKTKSLLLKLYELSVRGVDGEKENAQYLLDKICKEHNVNINDLLDAHNREVQIKVISCNFQKRIFLQIAFKMGFDKGIVKIGNKKTNEVWVKCSDVEFIELIEEYEFYKKEWKKEQKEFFLAFIHTNKIFPENDDKDEDSDTELTTEQIRVLLKMQGMTRANYRKPVKKLNQ